MKAACTADWERFVLGGEKRYFCYLQKERTASLLSSCINLSSGGRWKDEDVGGGGILGGGQGARCRVPSEPLVWRELLVHHAQHLEADVTIWS